MSEQTVPPKDFERDPVRSQQQFAVLSGKLRRFFSWRCQGDPDDMASETIARALRYIAAEKPVTDVEGLCYAIANNVLKERWKKRQEISLADEDTRPEPDFLGLTAGERAILLEQCLSELAAEERELLRQYYHDEHPIIALQHNLSANALRIRVFRILERIRARVGRRL